MIREFEHNIDKMVFENFIKNNPDQFDFSVFQTNAMEIFAKWIAAQAFLEGMEYQKVITTSKPLADYRQEVA